MDDPAQRQPLHPLLCDPDCDDAERLFTVQGVFHLDYRAVCQPHHLDPPDQCRPVHPGRPGDQRRGEKCCSYCNCLCRCRHHCGHTRHHRSGVKDFRTDHHRIRWYRFLCPAADYGNRNHPGHGPADHRSLSDTGNRGRTGSGRPRRSAADCAYVRFLLWLCLNHNPARGTGLLCRGGHRKC